MDRHDKTISSRHNTANNSKRSYIVGYALSLVLTLIPFVIVVENIIWGWALYITLAGFAVAQVFVQLNFFIHLGYEQRPRWSRVAFAFMLICLAILVIGSLWIMQNLDYNMMHHPNEPQIPKNEGF